MITSAVEWHILSRDPTDLPDQREKVLTTVETISGERKVYLDIYLRYTDDGYCWCQKGYRPVSGVLEEIMVWSPVVAWAYPPEPYYWI